MPGNHALPIHRHDLLDELLGFQRVEVDHAEARDRSDRDGVDQEDDLFLRQPHHDVGIRMVGAEIAQLERGAAERNGLVGVERLVGQDRVGIAQRREPFRHPPVRDDARAGILERLAAGDVVIVMMAVDQIFDRLVGHLPDLVDIGLSAGRAPVGDRIGGDYAVAGDDEHRLVIDVAEDVDVVGALDLGGLDRRPVLGRRRDARGRGDRRGEQDE
jgi:hypothetical protein